MSKHDPELIARLNDRLEWHSTHARDLPGIENSTRRACFVRQIVDSVHRVKYIGLLRSRAAGGSIGESRADPSRPEFHPLKAALLRARDGAHDDAFWLVFLATHFGPHKLAGWRYAREVYGALGEGRWDWPTVCSDPVAFRDWLGHRRTALEGTGPHGFGNHRKYESLDAHSPNGTGAVVESYVAWVAPPQTHSDLFGGAIAGVSGDARAAFDALYVSMGAVRRFGRTARFDYLTMVGKLGLAPIEPGSAYIVGATGPLRGAKLLYGRDATARDFDAWIMDLDADLDLPFGMQVLEDALCNWQKCPDRFIAFRA